MNKIIWQPKNVYLPSYEFNISLDRTFAKEMLAAKIPREKQKRMNELALETLIRQGFNWPGPLTFYEDRGLVTQFYIGRNGVWLATNCENINSLFKKDENKHIKYYSHNVDNSSQAYALMALVDQWVEYSDVLKE
jgi:hypothetical protein